VENKNGTPEYGVPFHNDQKTLVRNGLKSIAAANSRDFQM
jgi:hypothetical protein